MIYKINQGVSLFDENETMIKLINHLIDRKKDKKTT